MPINVLMTPLKICKGSRDGTGEKALTPSIVVQDSPDLPACASYVYFGLWSLLHEVFKQGTLLSPSP